jgi:hypothetical protein
LRAAGPAAGPTGDLEARFPRLDPDRFEVGVGEGVKRRQKFLDGDRLSRQVERSLQRAVTDTQAELRLDPWELARFVHSKAAAFLHFVYHFEAHQAAHFLQRRNVIAVEDHAMQPA